MSFFNVKKLGRTLAAAAVIAVSTVSTVSALDLSMGFGAFYTGDIGAGYYGLKGDRNVPVQTMYGAANGHLVIEEEVPWNGGGFNFFFDAQYAEVGFGIYLGVGERTGTETATVTLGNLTQTRTDNVHDNIAFVALNVGLLLKFPIEVNENLAVFPLAGIDYALVLAGTEIKDFAENKIYGAGEFSAVEFKFGAGLDLSLSEKWFFRPEILYGFRLTNGFEKDQIDLAEKSGGKMEAVSGHGPTVKLCFGRKL